MGWLNPPAITLRKLVPVSAHPTFNRVEEYAQHRLSSEPDHQRPYQLGIVLASWTKAGVLAGEITITPAGYNKVVAVEDSCCKVLRGDAFTAFHILVKLSEEGGTFGVPSEVYTRIAFNAASYR